MNIFSNPIFLRGIERIIIAIGGIIISYLGYRLFTLGITSGSSKVSAKSKLFHIIFSGSAPGLFFMFAGGIILILSIYTGGASIKPISKTETVNNDYEMKINSPPFADAGIDQVVYEGEKIILNGSGSNDPDDGIISFYWEQIEGPHVQIENSKGMISSFICPNVGDQKDLILVFRLSVRVGVQALSEDFCVIKVLSKK